MWRALTARFKRLTIQASIQSLPPTPAETIGDPHVFSASAQGSGVFGEWIIDQNGLPAYRYTLDQHQDSRARYANSEDLDRRDHWYIIGNDRITGLVSNDGVVQAYLADRGGIFLNHYDNSLELSKLDTLIAALKIILKGIWRWLQSLRLNKAERQLVLPDAQRELQALAVANQARRNYRTPESYVGGYAYIDNGTDCWPTAYRYRPAGTDVSRVYGIGTFETEITYQNIQVKRTVYAPPGNDAVLLADVAVTNTSSTPQHIRYYEYWDVNIHQMKLQWIRTGAFAPIYDAERRALNGLFETTIEIKPDEAAIRFHQATPPNAPSRDRAELLNWYPPDVFLASLSGTPAEYYRYTDDFFGAGDASAPDAVSQRRSRQDKRGSHSPMPYCMVIRHDLDLPPGQTENLRFAYGAANRDEATLDFLQPYRTGDLLTALQQSWKKRLAYFSIGTAPELQREVAWNSYSLLASTVYNEFFDVSLTPQGSAYLFLHGADGVPRDYALFAIPLTYIQPALAKDLLRLIMQMRDASTLQIAYAVSGHGYLDGGDVHEAPSDLDLFFLLALCEYLAATGDNDFLQEPVGLYPPDLSPKNSVLEHTFLAVQHLIDHVGRGENGLIRMSDGDWSDGVVVSNVLSFPTRVSLKNSIANGESIPNTQMALYVLPRVAHLLDAHRPQMAAQLRTFVQELEAAVVQQWADKWYTRAILRGYRNEAVIFGDKNIDLESQPWALISGLAERQGVADQLIDSIDTLLDADSPIGAPLLENGAVWPAISQLLTWGYVRYRPDLAWRSFCRNTFTARAAEFPEIWFNIWSGPDGINSKSALLDAGGTWVSPATPMTDFPAMNNNQHGMSLLALLRVCGIEPLADGSGLRISPHTPARYALDLPLLKLDVSPEAIQGEYRPVSTGQRQLHLQMPVDKSNYVLRIAGQAAAGSLVEGCVALELNMVAGTPISFEIIWS